MREIRLGPRVSVRIYGGARTVGGNCIVVDDRGLGLRVMLDQGINFQAYGRYFGGYIEPRTLRELYEVGAIPPPEAYDGVDAVFVSHLHLDHLGAMSMAEDAGAELYVPHPLVLSELVRSWEWTWKNLLLPSSDVAAYARTVREWRGVVQPVRVSHSAYPSYAFLVRTSEGSVLYTGDLRVGPSPLGVNTLENLARAVGDEGVDLLIAEGTNLGAETTPLDYDIAEATLDRALSAYGGDVLFVSYHPLDVETFLSFYRVLRRRGYGVVLLHEMYAGVLDAVADEVGLEGDLYFYDIHRGSQRRGFGVLDYIGSPALCRLAEAKPTDRVAVVLSYRAVDELRDLADQGADLDGSLLVHFTSEPRGEEMRMVEMRMGAWLRRFGINSYRLRVSGHYYPHQLESVLEAVKPKRTVFVHSRMGVSSHIGS